MNGLCSHNYAVKFWSRCSSSPYLCHVLFLPKEQQELSFLSFDRKKKSSKSDLELILI